MQREFQQLQAKLLFAHMKQTEAIQRQVQVLGLAEELAC
jgi:hypothetical protein